MKKAKILLVDDDGLFLLAHRAELERAGYEVWTARDGREALEVAGREEIDIAFVDLILPQEDGIEVCRELGRISPRTTAVILTGYPYQLSPRLRKYLNEAGYVGKLKKPLREDELVRTIEGLLRERRRA